MFLIFGQKITYVINLEEYILKFLNEPVMWEKVNKHSIVILYPLESIEILMTNFVMSQDETENK